MSTLADFRWVVSSKIGLDNTPAGDQPLIDRWVNQGVVQTLTRGHSNVYPGQMALTPGYGDYGLPSQILALEEMTVSPVGDVVSYLLERRSPREIGDMRILSAGGTPPVRYYALNGATLLMVYPTPAAADVLNIYYIPRPATLALPTDSPTDIPDEWHTVIEYYACWQAAQFIDSATTQEGNLYRQLFENELKNFKTASLHRGGRKLSRAHVGRTRAVVGAPSQRFA